MDQEHAATLVSLLGTILSADTEREALEGEFESLEPERICTIHVQLSEIDSDRARRADRNRERAWLLDQGSGASDGQVFLRPANDRSGHRTNLGVATGRS